MSDPMRQYRFPVVRKLPGRWLHKRIADAGGYFWLPCNLCGQMMSGFEWSCDMAARPDLVHSIPAPDGPKGRSIGICLACAEVGRGWTDPQLRIDHDLWLEELGIDPIITEEP